MRPIVWEKQKLHTQNYDGAVAYQSPVFHSDVWSWTLPNISVLMRFLPKFWVKSDNSAWSLSTRETFHQTKDPVGWQGLARSFSHGKLRILQNKRSLAVARIPHATAFCISVQTIWNSLDDDDRKPAELLNTFTSKQKTELFCIALSRPSRVVLEH